MPAPTYHALIDWTAGTITINGLPLPWTILADGMRVTHPGDDYPIGTIVCTVLAARITLDDIHIELDDETMPWPLAVQGPRVKWLERIWAVELPILVDRITEYGTRTRHLTVIADQGQGQDTDGEERSEGECDHCLMEPGDVGPLGICCACSIGQGASPELCECGAEELVGVGSEPDPDADRDTEFAIRDEVL